ncbi:MAG TPA: HlyD family secretion protein [Tepidisphaeraceae bacterium]|nr:HlyD family secretion protein [Tepidisphaeraceae bacterium]
MPLGRIVRGVLAVGALAVGTWAVAHKMSTVHSVDGVVNAELTILRAPARGMVVAMPLAKGRSVAEGELLLRLANRSQQHEELRKLELELIAAADRVRTLRSEIKSLEEAEAQFVENLRQFQRAAIEGGERRLAEAEAEERVAQLAKERDVLERDRQEKMVTTQASSTIEVDRARNAAAMSVENAAAAAERVARLRGEVEAMRGGIYLDRTNNNVPYQQQRADEVRLRLTELRSRLADGESEQGRLDRTVTLQKALPKYQDEIRLEAPAQGVVWDAMVAPGSDVDEGDPLLALADPNNLFAVVYLDAKYFDACAAGAAVEVRFPGSRRWAAARVRHVVGGATRFEDRPLAAALPKAMGKRAAVIVAIDGSAGDAGAVGPIELANYIGRKVEVRVKRDVTAARVLRDLLSRS